MYFSQLKFCNSLGKKKPWLNIDLSQDPGFANRVPSPTTFQGGSDITDSNYLPIILRKQTSENIISLVIHQNRCLLCNATQVGGRRTLSWEGVGT